MEPPSPPVEGARDGPWRRLGIPRGYGFLGVVFVELHGAHEPGSWIGLQLFIVICLPFVYLWYTVYGCSIYSPSRLQYTCFAWFLFHTHLSPAQLVDALAATKDLSVEMCVKLRYHLFSRRAAAALRLQLFTDALSASLASLTSFGAAVLWTEAMGVGAG